MHRCASHARTTFRRVSWRKLSEEVASSNKNQAAEFSLQQEIVRHGQGDAYITLNVGGTEFHTLRSTIASNTVLAEHVARAEANKEITKDGAVFIDRDPKHFDFILQHLRNKMDLDSFEGAKKLSLLSFTKMYTDLPHDKQHLRELYNEASFYRIEELRSALCEQSWLAGITKMFNKKDNPFDSASKFLTRMRAGLLAFGSVGTVSFTMQQDIEKVLESVGLKKNDKESIGKLVKD